MMRTISSTDKDMDNGEDEIRYRPNSGFGEYAAWFTCGTVMGFAIGWLAFLAYRKWPEWWLLIGACSLCSFLIGLICLIGLVAGTWVHVKQCITLMRINAKEVERRSTISHNNQIKQSNED